MNIGMVTISMTNFGPYGFYGGAICDVTGPNGSGKTTLLNAYLWALTGKTLAGYEPRKCDAPDGDPTQVRLYGFAGTSEIRRIMPGNGETQLLVDMRPVTQSQFAQDMLDRGVDVAFAALCCNANALTSDALTSDDLRTLLVRTDVLDGGEIAALQRKAKDVRERRRQAEIYACSAVTVPPRTVERPDELALHFMEAFEAEKRIVDTGVRDICPMCKQLIPDDERQEQQRRYGEAQRFVKSTQSEYDRHREQLDAHNKETAAIADAERIIERASKARADVLEYETRLKDIERKIQALTAAKVSMGLPDGVEVVTEQKLKNGSTRSVCQLTWRGVPLKSVNRARRIEICVRILDAARKAKGMQSFPIWLDNAEAVQGLQDVDNVIRLTVG